MPYLLSSTSYSRGISLVLEATGLVDAFFLFRVVFQENEGLGDAPLNTTPAFPAKAPPNMTKTPGDDGGLIK